MLFFTFPFDRTGCAEVDPPRERGHRQDLVQQAIQAADDLHPAAALGHHRWCPTLLSQPLNRLQLH